MDSVSHYRQNGWELVTRTYRAQINRILGAAQEAVQVENNQQQQFPDRGVESRSPEPGTALTRQRVAVPSTPNERQEGGI